MDSHAGSGNRLGATAALAAVWFTASDPTFLFTTRMDWGPVVLQRLCLALGCLLLPLLHERKQARYSFAAFFVFGLGLFDKITFHWLLLGLGVAGLVVFPREIRQGLRVRWVALAVAGFLLGGVAVYRLPIFRACLGHGRSRHCV